MLSAVVMVVTCHCTKPLDLGKWGRVWSAVCNGAVETEQPPQMKRAGHCPLRAGTVAHTEISALAGAHTESGWTWL